MKLPNKYGCVRKLSGARRRPWAVVLTTGWTADGKQVREYLGYYTTKKDALAALAAYHESPFELSQKNVTFSDLYQAWLDTRKPNAKNYNAAYNNLADLHKMIFRDIRKRHIQAVIDKCPLSRASLLLIKTLCNLMYKFAIDQELVNMNYASLVELPKNEPSEKHKPFTAEEIKELFDNRNLYAAQIALILIYTGMRPGELLALDPATIDLETRTMRGGIKTTAGKNRIIPIADKILPIIKQFDFGALPKRANRLIVMWKRSNVPALQNHLPHDGRHTCASLLDDAEISLKTRQMILGHSSGDVTNKVYTHKTTDQLLAAINRI